MRFSEINGPKNRGIILASFFCLGVYYTVPYSQCERTRGDATEQTKTGKSSKHHR